MNIFNDGFYYVFCNTTYKAQKTDNKINKCIRCHFYSNNKCIANKELYNICITLQEYFWICNSYSLKENKVNLYDKTNIKITGDNNYV